MTHGSTQFLSLHFNIEELAEGVYAVVGDRTGLCHSNAAIADLGDQTLVLDTLTLPSYGDDLARACRKLTGRDPSWIAFTHYHADHLLGNQSFPASTPMIATPAMLAPTREWMVGYQEAIDNPDGFKQEVADFADTCEAGEDPDRRALTSTWLGTKRLIRRSAVFDLSAPIPGSRAN